MNKENSLNNFKVNTNFELDAVYDITNSIGTSFRLDYLDTEENLPSQKKTKKSLYSAAGATVCVLFFAGNLSASPSFNISKGGGLVGSDSYCYSTHATIEDVRSKYSRAIKSADFHGPSLSDLIRKIISFKALEYSWDGYGAVPLEVESASNAIKVLTILGDKMVESISDIYPNPNGTVSIDFENDSNERIAVEIGNLSFSYYVKFNSQSPIFYENIEIREKDLSQLISEIGALY